jgi:hypothetical protein
MSNKVRDGQKAVAAVQNKIQNKFFKEKISVSMYETEGSKDARARNSLSIGEEYTDGDGKVWFRDENGVLKNQSSFLGKYTMPFFCPDCNKIMKGKADNKMWALYSKCMDCVAIIETNLKAKGKFEEYENTKITANANSWVKDMEQLAKDWIVDNNKEKEQFVMNSSGEMETWDVKGKKNHNLESLKEKITNVEKQLKEK